MLKRFLIWRRYRKLRRFYAPAVARRKAEGGRKPPLPRR